MRCPFRIFIIMCVEKRNQMNAQQTGINSFTITPNNGNRRYKQLKRLIYLFLRRLFSIRLSVALDSIEKIKIQCKRMYLKSKSFTFFSMLWKESSKRTNQYWKYVISKRNETVNERKGMVSPSSLVVIDGWPAKKTLHVYLLRSRRTSSKCFVYISFYCKFIPKRRAFTISYTQENQSIWT